MVKVAVFNPHPLLSDFVQNIFVIDAVIDPKDGNMVGHYPPTPQNCIFLYINQPLKARKVGEKEFFSAPRALVVGPQVTRMELMINRDHKVAVIGFLPGGLFRLLGIPLSEIYDEGYDAYDLIGKDVYDLLDRCAEMSCLQKIKQEVDNYLLSKLSNLKEILPIDRALNLMLSVQANTSISQIASDACLSLRQFERKCKERLGMSPKLYARLIRFSNAYRLFERSPNPNWSEIAYLSGYYDQMHFIKDFKEFSGITPSMMEEALNEAPFRFQAPIRI
ncbi:helix-turn-helix domain-containing protein [Pararhodonellum marinum]|uniref:helix-turn-helix domain-containing protein n=1 Tax=Pararhodonellum marinum TaxID=2755358 RepID=UPI00188FE3B0|nr:helix-turn-helix domain-containing protein [Pararhodonellum marinum]